MALPLKSGADLYTQELLRARLHNFDGDLAEYGTGSIYFNTTSGLNTSDRIRYRGLAGWHSVANLEDIARLEEMIGNLDFAGSEDFIGITSRVAALEGNFTNGAAKDAVKFGGQLPSYYATQSAFSALQEKVNAFLDGDVDSDAVLENLKEIQTFLDSYDGATSLVDLLDAKADKSQLSGYLPLSGGTVTGSLTVSRSDSSTPFYVTNSHTPYTAIAFRGSTLNYAYLIYSGTGDTWEVTNEGWNRTSVLLHANNFNSYAPTLTGTGASGTWAIDISGRAKRLTNNYVNNLDNAPVDAIFASGFQASNRPATNYATGFTLENPELGRYVQFAIDTDAKAHIRQKGTTWSAWKTLAFTDSDITGNAASATKLQTARKLWGNSFDGTADVNTRLTLNANDAALAAWKKDGSSASIFLQVNPDRHLLLGQGTARENGGLYLYGNDIRMCYGNTGSSNNTAMLINSSGNVGIGTASPTQKLDVRGNQYITGYIYADGDLNTGQWLKTSTGVAFGSAHTLTFNSYSIISNAELSFTNISTTDISTGIKAAIKAGLMQINDIIGHRIFLGNNTAGTASNQPFSICTYSSVSNYAPANVTELFRVDPTGEVTIKQDLIVEGNVIAYGQVSSGGVAEEGTGVGGSLERVTFTIPANTITFECEHNLGTKEISVSIYEEGGDYQQILADVYLDSTNIARIVFGRATDVAHKVVIIG